MDLSGVPAPPPVGSPHGAHRPPLRRNSLESQSRTSVQQGAALGGDAAIAAAISPHPPAGPPPVERAKTMARRTEVNFAGLDAGGLAGSEDGAGGMAHTVRQG